MNQLDLMWEAVDAETYVGRHRSGRRQQRRRYIARHAERGERS